MRRADARGRGVEGTIARVLLWGGVAGGALMAIGLALFAGQGALAGSLADLHRPVAGAHGSVAASLREIWRGLTARPLDPLAVIDLGLVGLVLTPVAGVATAIPAFLREGDRRYAVVAVLVLAMLLAGLALGGRAG